MLISGGLSAPLAQAAYIVTLEQQGTNVVETGSGSIDLTGLSSSGEYLDTGGMIPKEVYILGGIVNSDCDGYKGITGPANFWSGDFTAAHSSSGDDVGLNCVLYDSIFVPLGYVSGSPLSASAT